MAEYEGPVEKRILNAAKALFAEKGHEETRLREIATSARTSESQVIKYYESKAGLLEALIRKVITLISDSLDKAQKDTENPILLLEKFAALLLDLFEKEPELFKVYLFSRRYYALASEEQLTPEIQFRTNLSTVFKRGQKAGTFRTDIKPHAAASVFYGSILGLMRDKLYAMRSKGFPNVTRKELKAALNTLVLSFVSKERSA